MNLLFELNLTKAPHGSREIAKTLYRQLKDAILEGRLAAGARLPSTRNARTILGVSRNTAQDVYDRLVHEGLAAARHGSGTFVASPLDPGSVDEREHPAEPDARLNPFWLREDVAASIGFWQEAWPAARTPASAIDLRPALIDPRSFPFAIFRQLMVRELRRLETRPASFKSPQGNQGNFQLRHGIAEHIALTRAVACRPDDVLVTSGAQQAFDLIARIMVKPGETIVAVEDPGYPSLRVAFAAAGARLVPVRVDAEGIVVDELPRDVGVICVCPSHQFPLGMSMSPARRLALLDFARSSGAVIVEDDYDGEFRYDGAPLDALRSHASADLVFYVGTFSKCMLPSLRLGFVVAPRWAMRALTAAKNSVDWHCSTPLQMAVAAFIADGHLARHVRRMRRVYRERRDLVLRLIDRDVGRRLRPITSYYGVHVTAIADDLDCERVSEEIALRGVQMHSLRRYHLGEPHHNGLVFGVGTADRDRIAEAIHRLSSVISARR